ncbi:MAG: hypothetical protein NTV05_03630 [Acidobacteria bacterium]|nr:hypothetical protein [Acidobacteriota bacterium]
MRIYAALEDPDGTFYYADFADPLKLREVIPGVRCATPVDEVISAVASYAEPPVIRRARLSLRPLKIVAGPAFPVT